MLFNVIGYAKLMLILLIGFTIYFAYRNDFPLELIFLSLAAFIILAGLWVCHNKLNDRINYLKGIISIYNQQIDRITGNWINFEDIGAEFIDIDHAYACDLDVVGKKSLFQFLNTAHTWHGRQAFANDLLRSVYGRTELQKRQEAVAELSEDIEFSSKIQYYLSKVKGDSSSRLADYLKDKTVFIRSEALRSLLFYMPMLTLLLIVGIFVIQQQHLFFIVVLIATVQAIAWVLGVPRTHKYFGAMSHLPHKLKAYNEVIGIIIGKDVSSEKLKQIQEKLNEAAQAIKDLSKIEDRMSVKHNAIIYFIVNIFLLWDYECAFLLQEWRQKYAHLSEQWFMAIGEFESLLCLSHLPNVCDNTCLPTLNEKGNVMEARELGHPLLLNENRVNNGFSFNNNIFIISGSNMSGKTTFLRTVGINIVLARSGGFVCAEEMFLSPFDVVSSMRIADDLNEGVSTFYSELKRIKMMIDLAKKQPNMIFLIDEIFRGTNSADRLAGAKTVIEKLSGLGSVGLISTHDLELCELANAYGRIKNYSFSEHYKDNRICFDYKMKQGKSNSSNAKYLMGMIGILD